jgi:ACS family hexuronate transporter-like MFS transporter
MHALVAGFVALAGVRSLLAFGEAGNWPGAARTVAEWFPARERALGMAIFNSGVALGAVIAPPIVVAVQLRFGWQRTFLVTAALGAVWLVLWLLLYRAPERHPWLGDDERALIRGGAPTAAPARPPLPFRVLLRRRQVWAIMAARLCTDPIWWLYVTWLPQYLADARGFDLRRIGAFAWIPYFAAGVGALAGGWTSGRLIARGASVDRARKVCLLIGAVLMPAGVLAASARTPGGAIALVSVVLFAFQFWINNVQALPGDLFPSTTVGAVFGLGGVAAGVGSFAFMMLSGFVVQRFSYAPMFVAAGLLGPLGAVALFALAGRIERVEA